MHIISASRRTDIPAFYAKWFMNRIRAGSVRYRNPFGGQVCGASLDPGDVHSIVFWSKYYGPLLPHLEELHSRGYRYYFHYTITGAPREQEPHVPAWPTAAKVLRRLAEKTSPRHVLWRFDPILLTDPWTPEAVVDRFRAIADAVAGATERCYFSFAMLYGKVLGRLRRAGIRYVEPSPELKRQIVDAMADIAEPRGITLHACCQDDALGPRVRKAHCVDADLLATLFPDRPMAFEQRPTRPQCGCAASRDIGMYDTCPYACVYCYANVGVDRPMQRFRQHDPGADMLMP